MSVRVEKIGENVCIIEDETFEFRRNICSFQLICFPQNVNLIVATYETNLISLSVSIQQKEETKEKICQFCYQDEVSVFEIMQLNRFNFVQDAFQIPKGVNLVQSIL